MIAMTLAALALQVQQSPTADRLSALPAREAAGMLLSPERAARVVHHHARGPSSMSPPSETGRDIAQVSFHTEAQETAPGLCRRERFGVRAERRPDGEGGGVRPVGEAYARTQLRLDADCAGAADRPFVDLNIGEEEASRMLLRLRALRDDARAGRPLAVRVECLSEHAAYACPADTVGLVADLPLEGAYMAGRTQGSDPDTLIAATETRPGNLYWEIRFSRGEPSVLILKRRIPPPF